VADYISVIELIHQLSMLRQLLEAQDRDPNLVWVFYEKVPIKKFTLREGVNDNVDVVLKG
jgi:hypothetical protein